MSENAVARFLLWMALALAMAPAIAASGTVHPVHPATWGEHGMVLFGGRDGLFASHLPMFHAPHDYHVVIALRIADPTIDAAMRKRLAATPRLWTIVPEEFELSRLAPASASPLTHFKAEIVEGHFERGGKALYHGVDVRVLHTDRFVQLDPSARTAATAHFEPVGNGRTWFLVKEVRARPDFDQVVMLAADRAPGAVDVPASGVDETSDSALAKVLTHRARVVGTVYYDTQDLR